MKKITFLVSNNCNFRCKHCFVCAGNKKDNEMNKEEKHRAIDKIYELGVEKISFSGGEPLMDKNIFEYMSYAKQKKLKIGFLTNGLMLDDEKIKMLEKLEIDSLSISLYTNDIIELNQLIYDKYLEKTIDTLKKISKTSLEYKLTIPVSAFNIDDTYKLLKLIANNDLNPKTIRLYIITPVGRAKENRNLCTENMDVTKLLNNLPKEAIKLNISIEHTDTDEKDCNKINKFSECQILKYKKNYINKYADPHMDVNGDLYLCGLLLRKQEYCIGNILSDSKNNIFGNIDKLVEKIEIRKKIDPCPMLNRIQKKKRKLICPIIYTENKQKTKICKETNYEN